MTATHKGAWRKDFTGDDAGWQVVITDKGGEIALGDVVQVKARDGSLKSVRIVKIYKAIGQQIAVDVYSPSGDARPYDEDES